MRLPVAALLFAVAGCAIDPNPPNGPTVEKLDWSYFACNVQRPLIRRCSMLACHGQADHAFRVYSPGKLRDPTLKVATLNERNAPITLAEVQANKDSALGFTFNTDGTPESTMLVNKIIAPSQGGGEHVGGVVFRDLSDPDLKALYAWLGGATDSGGCDFLTQLQAGM